MKVEPRNDVQKFQGLAQPTPLGNAPAQVTRSDSLSSVDDAGMLFNQQLKRSSKALSGRRLRARVKPVEQLPQLYEQLGHPAQATLAAVARRVRIKLLQQSSLAGVLELTDNDPAKAYVVLKQLTAQAEAEVRKADAALARDALAKLELRFQREIQAGLNIAMALQAASDDPQIRQAVRLLYYASVVARQSLATMMQALLGLFGGERFGEGLNVMRRALADDIAANAPSVDTAKLRTLLLGLRSGGQLSSILLGCRKLITRLRGWNPDLDQDEVVLLQRLLGYASAGVAFTEVQSLGMVLGGQAPSLQLKALNAIYPVIEELPLGLWRDSRGRQDALHSFLLVMDEYTRNERASLLAMGRPRVGE